MTDQSARSEPFKTPVCRFSYVKDMFERKVKKTDDGQVVRDAKTGKEITLQTCTLIFDNTPENKASFERVLQGVLREKWGDNGITRFKAGLIHNPLLAGDGVEAKNKKTGEIRPGLGADKFFIRVATQREVPVLYKSKLVPAKYGEGPDEIKSGDYGFAVLSAYTWHNAKKGDGISFGIEYLQKTRDGESLGGVGGISVDDFYESVQGTPAMAGASADSLFA